jgi:hypothetical protein
MNKRINISLGGGAVTACMGEMRNLYENLEDLGENGRIRLECYRNKFGRCGLDAICLRIGACGGLF